jgi:predicted DNA-binding transcriptional regulator AlpA
MPIASPRKAPIALTSGKKTVGQSFTAASSIPQAAEVKRTDGNEASDEVIFLRLPEVKGMTGLSKSSLYALIQEKSFPKPVRLGTRAVAWVRSEVRQWAFERISASR